MKSALPLVVITVILTVITPNTALAGGWGPYFGWGHETQDTGLPEIAIDAAVKLAEWYAQWYGDPTLVPQVRAAADEASIGLNLDHFTLGVMYDSAPKTEKLFSYRATLGLDIAYLKTGDIDVNIDIPGYPGDLLQEQIFGGLDKTTLYGISSKHTLAFSLVRNARLKWWAGPSLGLKVNYRRMDMWIPAARYSLHHVGNMSIGGGAETGINIHISPDMSLCLGGGLHWYAFGFGAATGGFTNGSVVWGNGPFFFIQTAILFHTSKDRAVTSVD